MNAIADFLFPSPAERRAGAIVSWWERRRLPYNVVVGSAGAFSYVVFHLAAWMPPYAENGFIPVQSVVAFGVLANVCYLLGPTVEILLDRIWGRSLLPTGPALYRMGLTFSVGLALLPALAAVLFWMVRIVAAIF